MTLFNETPLPEPQDRVPLAQARAQAHRLYNDLWPHCYDCAIAGSIRRRKESVKDVELVCLPHPTAWADFLAAVRRYPILKGKPTPAARYLKLQLEGIQADVFIAGETNWGWILTLRTGPAEFNLELLAALKRRGVISKEGELYLHGEHTHVRDEDDVFALLGVPAPEPQDRVPGWAQARIKT